MSDSTLLETMQMHHEAALEIIRDADKQLNGKPNGVRVVFVVAMVDMLLDTMPPEIRPLIIGTLADIMLKYDPEPESEEEMKPS